MGAVLDLRADAAQHKPVVPDLPHLGAAARGTWLGRMVNEYSSSRVFEGLAEGGTIKAFLQETFWAARFGAVVDRFGIEWAVNCEQPAGVPR